MYREPYTVNRTKKLKTLVKNILSRFIPENNRYERIWILAKYDFKSRYYYNYLGVIWALIKPFFEFLVYYVVFTYFFPGAIENFALYLFLGLILWYFFLEGTNKGINILQQKRYLLENIPFNRGDLLISTTFSAFMAFMFNMVVYLLLSLSLGVIPFHSSIVYFPFLMTIYFLLVMGFGMILATISIHFKDIQHLWDMFMLAGLWLTPILYDKQMIIDNLPALIYINPVSGLIINVREVLLYGNDPDFQLLGFNIIYTIVIFAIGFFVFKSYSHKAAEKL